MVVVVHGWCSLKPEGPEEKGEEDGEPERKHLVRDIAREEIEDCSGLFGLMPLLCLSVTPKLKWDSMLYMPSASSRSLSCIRTMTTDGSFALSP